MCGIVAIFSYAIDAGPVGRTEVDRVRDRMAVRGPDAAGSWISAGRNVGMGHRRLAIIDLDPRANQPMIMEKSGTAITFNGEIYNYRELRRGLEQRGRVFHSSSDTEVLLHAYEEFGSQMVDHLRGMYAFAIWDSQRNGMFLARDPFGIKPLYVADTGKQILVASQVKALLGAASVGRATDPAGQVSFLLWGFIAEPHTLYSDIQALPAGSTMWIDRQGPRRPNRFWSVSEVLRKADPRPTEPTASEARRDTIRHALLESIGYHMVSDVPVGVFLSGGLDSGTLVALASKQASGDLHTLTLGMEELRGTAGDEVPFAEEIATTYKSKHSTHWIGADHFAKERERLLAAMDQPTVDGVNVYFISQMAAGAGLKVALSGLGGDELFGGYPSFQQVPLVARRLAPFAGLSTLGLGFRLLSAPILKHVTSPKYAGLFEYGTSLEGAYLLRRSLFMPWELPSILDPDLVKQGWEALAPQMELRLCTEGINNPHAKVAALEMTMYMRNQLLRDSDWAGMAHSLEIRVPFVDATLLRQLAPEIVGPHPAAKSDMVDALPIPLPADVLSRPKTGFTVPVREWVLKDKSIEALKGERGLRGWARYMLSEQLARGARAATEVGHEEPVQAARVPR